MYIRLDSLNSKFFSENTTGQKVGHRTRKARTIETHHITHLHAAYYALPITLLCICTHHIPYFYALHITHLCITYLHITYYTFLHLGIVRIYTLHSYALHVCFYAFTHYILRIYASCKNIYALRI